MRQREFCSAQECKTRHQWLKFIGSRILLLCPVCRLMIRALTRNCRVIGGPAVDSQLS